MVSMYLGHEGPQMLGRQGTLARASQGCEGHHKIQALSILCTTEYDCESSIVCCSAVWQLGARTCRSLPNWGSAMTPALATADFLL
jgi:hypothetical protein